MFTCERWACTMMSRDGCAKYQALKPWKCEGCKQRNRAKKAKPLPYIAMQEYHERAGKRGAAATALRLSKGELDQLFGV